MSNKDEAATLNAMDVKVDLYENRGGASLFFANSEI